MEYILWHVVLKRSQGILQNWAVEKNCDMKNKAKLMTANVSIVDILLLMVLNVLQMYLSLHEYNIYVTLTLEYETN